MYLAIDCGNTNIVFAVCEGAKRYKQWRCATEANRTADEYSTLLNLWFAEAGMVRSEVTGMILASVVPTATQNFRRLAEQHLKVPLLVVGDDTLNLGLKIDVDTPAEIGADRLVNALAAIESGYLPALIVDFGTATTFDLVDKDGIYRGGAIAPGVNLSLEALHKAAAKLPRVDVIKPKKVIGRTTVEAMQSGIFWGYVSLIDGMIKLIEAEHGQALNGIATGGLAELYASAIPALKTIDPDLTIKGLQAIWLGQLVTRAA